jgi:hypothetical protein
MAKAGGNAVSVIPVRGDPGTRLLRQVFRITREEYSVLKLCASAPKPSDCTAKQRLLFRQLKERCLVQVIEYPCFDGPRWVLSMAGEVFVNAAARLLEV